MTAARGNRYGHGAASMILVIAAKRNRYGYRDAPMILLAFRHGLRACELVDLDAHRSTSRPPRCMCAGHVRRAKEGTESTHLLRGDELRTLRRLKREPGVIVRVCERARVAVCDGRLREDGRASRSGGWLRFQSAPALAAPRLWVRARQPRRCTRGLQAYLGHRSIQQLSAMPRWRRTDLRDFWRYTRGSSRPRRTKGRRSAPSSSAAMDAARRAAATAQSQCLTTLCGALWFVFHEQQERFW
jgi:hypothetical protein